MCISQLHTIFWIEPVEMKLYKNGFDELDATARDHMRQYEVFCPLNVHVQMHVIIRRNVVQHPVVEVDAFNFHRLVPLVFFLDQTGVFGPSSEKQLLFAVFGISRHWVQRGIANVQCFYLISD